MAFPYAIKIFGGLSIGDVRYDDPMADRSATGTQGRRPIRSEARGPHWVAWLPDANGRPEGSVVLVGGTREEAEERAVELSEQNRRR
jgi:hypothetical protein